MTRISVFPALVFLLTVAASVPLVHAQAPPPDEWLTRFERSGGTETPDYEETVAYLKRLDDASPWIAVSSLGVSPQGRDMPFMVLSRDGAFTPEAARATKKPVVLIMGGIHAGEIDGKDAGMMLVRDIAVTRTQERLADKAIILFLPMFNVDGHERRGKYNRFNQDGPEVTGWRTTAHNLNLNRDFMKADAPEMRMWLRMFDAWMPEMTVDCHVTDGIDFQYNVTYTMEMFANMSPRIVKWQKAFDKVLTKRMAAFDDPIAPYVLPREDRDLSKGIRAYAATPRFSTGYVAIRNRSGLLIEAHSLKPFKQRVESTYRMLVETIAYINQKGADLRKAVEAADLETVDMFRARRKPAVLPLRFTADSSSSSMPFYTWKSEIRDSDISGGTYQVWDHSQPDTVRVPILDVVQTSLSVTAPGAYLLPAEYENLAEILRLHGVQLERLAKSQRVISETYVFDAPTWSARPYETRHRIEKITHRTRIDTTEWPAGSFVVRLAQTSGKVAVHLLEPDGPDSFLSWGMFDGIFEQKEYFEAHVMERIAPVLLAGDPTLRADFERKLASDSTFAANPRARLYYLYERSPWWDARQNVYPVGRVRESVGLVTVGENAWSRRRFLD